MKKSLLPVLTFARIDIKRLFRDKVGIFFVFIFPLLFLVVFGSIFRGDNDVSFRVAVINQADNQFTREFVDRTFPTEAQKEAAENSEENQAEDSPFKIDEEISSIEQAREKMNRGQIEATVVIPDTFGEVKGGDAFPSGELQVLYDQNNQSAGTTMASVLGDILKGVNRGLVPSSEPFTVKAESTATQGLTQFDYTFSGILGFTLLSLGIFGPTTVFPRLKQRGVLRRYQTTTLKVWQYFVGNVLSNGVIGLLAAGLMFVAAVLFFDLNMRGNYLNLAFIIILGVTMLFGIGLAIGGWAKNENQAAPLAQIATLPMMFLSGVFFPTFIMPEFLQRITTFIPLTAVVDSVRMIITENASLLELGPQVGIMAAWTVVIYAIAFKVFRWE